MSLYAKEKAEYFSQSMESILNQTVLPDEIVIVKDGPLTEELEKTLDGFVSANPSLYKTVPLETNRGLGLALAEGMLHCTNELVARMDTDDISRSDRFEKQLAEFEADPELDICGSHIIEFEDSPEHVVCKRTVPLDDADIKKYQKKRDGFNHQAVMFKKEAVISHVCLWRILFFGLT